MNNVDVREVIMDVAKHKSLRLHVDTITPSKDIYSVDGEAVDVDILLEVSVDTSRTPNQVVPSRVLVRRSSDRKVFEPDDVRFKQLVRMYKDAIGSERTSIKSHDAAGDTHVLALTEHYNSLCIAYRTAGII